MNRGIYNFLANYQWYFFLVFVYLFLRDHDRIFPGIGNLTIKLWLIASGILTLFTQHYFYRHKSEIPNYKIGYILLASLLTVLFFELYYYMSQSSLSNS